MKNTITFKSFFLFLFYILSILLVIHGNEVKFTMYWTTHEDEFPLGNDTTLKTCGGIIIADVSIKFAETLKLEGSGVLKDGRILNLDDCDCKGGFNCFEKVNASLGKNNNELVPYISIAANDMKYGTKVFVHELNGTTLPNNGKIHNGCVRVDDECWSCGDNHIDLYVFNKNNYKILDDILNGTEKVNIDKGSSCTINT